MISYFRLMQTLQDSLKYRQWADSLSHHGVTLHAVEDLKTIRKGNGEVLFSMIKLDAETQQGQKLLPIALLRGNFVSVCTCLVAEETGKAYFLLVAQRRVADGAVHYEHPAGMMDSETDPYVVALKEVEEETGLQIERDDLVLFNEELWFSSPGLLDEGGYFFGVRLVLPAETIQSFHDQSAGDGGEHEFIQTYIATYEECIQLIKNTNGRLNLMLFQEHFSG
jgi:8-oxo-dGTP pyrophosphatase MutT (NUDIX family)